MKQELDEQICKECPNLFKQRHGDLRQTAMCWGIETGDGWFNLLYDVCKDIEAEIRKLPEENRQYVKASQIKEKYGTLRLYMHSETDEMSYLIREAEELSSKTCEECGKPGELSGYGWLKTVCDEHREGETFISTINQLDKKEKRKIKLSDRLYPITRWFKHPKYCIDDVIGNLKWKYWKFKRFLKKKYGF